MAVTSTMSVMPPPGHRYTGAPPQVTRVNALLCSGFTDRVSSTGFSVTPARNEPPAPPMNSTEHKAGSQFSAIRSTAARIASGMGADRGIR